MKVYTLLFIIISTVVTEACDVVGTAAELNEFVAGCNGLATIYEGPYHQEELEQGIKQGCSTERRGCGSFLFQCDNVEKYHNIFCYDETVTAAAVTVAEAFDCLFQDEATCQQKSYCNYTKVLGAFVCVPLLEEEDLRNVIEQTCIQDREDVIHTVAALAMEKGENRDLASINAEFALDFYCGKDENNAYYFPENCPCEFGEFAKLHAYSNMVADGFGKSPLVCPGDSTGNRMKRAFSVNTAAVAEWRLRLAVQAERNCQASNEGECVEETQAANKARNYKNSALRTLNGMCVTDPSKEGPEAYCLHRLKTMSMNVKQCLMPLVMGKKAECSSECDEMLAPMMEEMTSGCCAATLQEYFAFQGKQERPFLYALSACNNTSAFINVATLGLANACPEVDYNNFATISFCLPLEWDRLQDFEEPLRVAIEEEVARVLGFVPHQAEVWLSDTTTSSCKFESGISATTVTANLKYDEEETPLVDWTSLVRKPAIRMVLEDNECGDCALVNEKVELIEEEVMMYSSATMPALVVSFFATAVLVFLV